MPFWSQSTNMKLYEDMCLCLTTLNNVEIQGTSKNFVAIFINHYKKQIVILVTKNNKFVPTLR
jgi:signal peptidase I